MRSGSGELKNSYLAGMNVNSFYLAANWSEINVRCILRASGRVQAPDCGAPASPIDLAAGWIRLSLEVEKGRRMVKATGAKPD
jgi:hypothetical protein